MAFDQKTRNLLQRTVAACRRILDREFTSQLQEICGIQPGGTIAPIAALGDLGDEELEIARLLRERINHFEGGSAVEALTRTQARPEHIARVIREQAFTVLNRLAALRLSEERGLVLECVRDGVNSEGFQLFLSSTGNALGETRDAYRVYLHCLFDELALDLGVLFDRFSPLGLLFPRHDALTEVLEELNGSGTAAEHEEMLPEHFAEIWQADETIGWIYQYWNSEEERKAARYDENGKSKAPQNSRELAIRNQFFTPRYVVEFLTDNTLGRIWYEMTQGETTLKEQCRHLVRRQNEIFLTPGEEAPAQATQDNLAQEDLLKQPVLIPHRPLKDPRTILMLDPACGSMHFGLYAFDLFEVIYDEAWELEVRFGPAAMNRAPGLKSLHDTYASKHALAKDVPRLIIEHNLHGIDIDSRCAQIAGLSLWLRAQRAWQRLGLKTAERPAVARSNIVCAEPMPGEKELLREFVEREFPAEERGVFIRLLEGIFDQMQLAGEAGSLLRIEEDIRNAISGAKELWKSGQPLEQTKLFTELRTARQAALTFDLSGITDEQFWDTVESRIYAALSDYAEQAENGGGFQRRLFAEDAARGFAFIDICRKRYDVALMNPPFGSFPLHADTYLNQRYPDCYGDFYPAFIQRWATASEILGAITNRTGLAVQSLQDWRKSVLLGRTRLVIVGDLGIGVLDALVETAMYVISHARHDIVCAFGMLDVPKHRVDDSILSACSAIYFGAKHASTYLCDLELFRQLPHAPIAYRLPQGIAHSFARSTSLEVGSFVFRTTNSTNDSFRFLRLRWEVPIAQDNDTASRRWVPLSKGGDYQPYFTDLELMICWDMAVGTYHGYVGSIHRPLVRPACADLFFRPGITWSERTASRFSPRVLPTNAIFTNVGPFAGGGSEPEILVNLGIMMSAPYQALLEVFLAAGDATSSGAAARHYQVGELRLVPEPVLNTQQRALIEANVRHVIEILQKRFFSDERSSLFDPGQWIDQVGSVSSLLTLRSSDYVAGVYSILSATREIDRVVAEGYRMSPEDTLYVEQCFGRHPLDYDDQSPDQGRLQAAFSTDTDQLIRKAVAEGVGGRFVTVKSYYADRHLEVISHSLKVSASQLKNLLFSRTSADSNLGHVAAQIFSVCAGVAIGRWKLEALLEPSQSRGGLNRTPFEALPVVPPVLRRFPPNSSTQSDAPFDVPIDGILVDDSTDPRDFLRRTCDALERIWKHSNSLKDELQRHLNPDGGDLRTWLRDGFFDYHLGQYSDSQRSAPIYWPLSTSSGSYTLWVYYHWLTTDTLYKCIEQFVSPKLADVEKELTHLRTVLALNEGGAKERRRLEEIETFHRELIDLRTELELWAPRWRPNLNDGVLITAAPLWKLFRLPKWQKDLKACWQELEKGDYDWAHLAYAFWPDRVREKCKIDRSLAIAHDLEELCEAKAPETKARKGKKNYRKSESELLM